MTESSLQKTHKKIKPFSYMSKQSQSIPSTLQPISKNRVTTSLKTDTKSNFMASGKLPAKYVCLV